MAKPLSAQQRLIGALVFLFVLVFAGFLAWQIWFNPGIERSAADATDVEGEAHATPATPAEAPDCTETAGLPADHALIGLPTGCVEIAFLPELAPKHVAQIKALAADHFYDGIVFHRVIDGFMAQTGDPTGTGMGGSELPDIAAEFSDEPFERGIVGMARSANPNSANSQFFIMLAPATHLNGQYTAFARVVSGMEFVDQIKKGSTAQNGQVENPDKMITFRVADSN